MVTVEHLRPDVPADIAVTPGGTFGGISAYLELMRTCWAQVRSVPVTLCISQWNCALQAGVGHTDQSVIWHAFVCQSCILYLPAAHILNSSLVPVQSPDDRLDFETVIGRLRRMLAVETLARQPSGVLQEMLASRQTSVLHESQTATSCCSAFCLPESATLNQQIRQLWPDI